MRILVLVGVLAGLVVGCGAAVDPGGEAGPDGALAGDGGLATFVALAQCCAPGTTAPDCLVCDAGAPDAR